VIDDIVTGKKELDVVAAIAPQANQHYMCMRNGLKVAFACMSQDGELRCALNQIQHDCQ